MQLRNKLKFLPCVYFAVFSSAAMLKTTVKIRQGKLQGALEEYSDVKYVSFKGIPYAKPPIGNLRFADPVPAEPWNGVRDASKHGNVCPQTLLHTNQAKGLEDCLYLNVYTPNTDGDNGAKYAVMVYIHGGAFIRGSGNSDECGPLFLLKQDVILVTLNYRLEAFGFLCLDLEEARGNVGLKDQALAMRWVKDNIENFGGDPENITIFGESAGAASVTYHLFSKSSKGLFQRVIAQSGVCTSAWAVTDQHVNAAFRVGKALGFETNDKKKLLDFLKSVPASDLYGITNKIYTGAEESRAIAVLFVPVIEKRYDEKKAFLDENIEDLLKRNDFADIPMIFGINSGEGIMEIGAAFKNKEKINQNWHTYINALGRHDFAQNLTAKIKQFYFKNEDFSAKTEENMIHLRSDALFTHDIIEFAKTIASKVKSPIYFYTFSYYGERNKIGIKFGVKSSKLVSHVDELNYMFDSYYNKGNVENSSDASSVIRSVTRMWTNMAKHGNPTPNYDNSLTTIWNPVTAERFQYLDIDLVIEASTDPLKDRMEFWDAIYKEHNRSSANAIKNN